MKIILTSKLKVTGLILIAFLTVGMGSKIALSEESSSVLYVPLIGITSVPQPLALPNGPGNVTYNYAVKNFLKEVSLGDVRVVDDKCSSIKFIEGDDNHDSKLDYSETWRYSCSTTLSVTTESIATATGTANDITATHKAYATVVVGSGNYPPLVSIVNITKVAYPLSLPVEGGDITFTYKVNNPGIVPLGGVIVADDKCKALSSKLGDTNVNNLLDINEVWIYTCNTHLTETTTNTVTVTAYANGLKAFGSATITVNVDTGPKLPSQEIPSLPDAGLKDLKVDVWAILSSILSALLIFYVLTRGKHKKQHKRKTTPLSKLVLGLFLLLAGVGIVLYFLFAPQEDPYKASQTIADNSFGWKFPTDNFPVPKFPITGEGDNQIAYSDIRDPGGIPQGLPVRLKIPVIGVDSAIEDALITPDGRMDVPAGSVNVAWFSLGPHPGQVGSAVIGGHFGIRNGEPFVFYNLDKLKVGDKIYIVDDRNDTLGFIVRSISLFNRDADATTVFTSNDGLAHLNLITCEGVWNQVNGTYPDRRVVFTDAIPAGQPIVVTPPSSVPVFPRLLAVGAQGTDVTALQTALAQKGFLTIPSGVAYGYFGEITRGALIRYQVSVGLPAVGVFGPLTRAKLTSELSMNPVLPDAGVDGPAAQTPASNTVNPSSPQVLVQQARDLYGSTLVDGLITLLLLFSIIFIGTKIIRR